jgi:elongation factor P hydroxylase
VYHDCQDLIRLFDGCFEARFNTVLRGGAEEPLYRPAGDHDPRHCVVFTRDYFASALHEVAHWCIAGARRRQLEDYGYWYCPDGRDAHQQRAFERVEARPQAIEWAFHIAAGSRFRASADNLSGDPADLEAFRRRIFERLCSYRREGFPPRAQVFIDTLCSFYDRRWQLPDAA